MVSSTKWTFSTSFYNDSASLNHCSSAQEVVLSSLQYKEFLKPISRSSYKVMLTSGIPCHNVAAWTLSSKDSHRLFLICSPRATLKQRWETFREEAAYGRPGPWARFVGWNQGPWYLVVTCGDSMWQI